MTDDSKKKECELPFWRDFSILFQDFSLQYKPNCPHSAWNFAARLILISLFIGMVGSALGGLPILKKKESTPSGFSVTPLASQDKFQQGLAMAKSPIASAVKKDTQKNNNWFGQFYY